MVFVSDRSNDLVCGTDVLMLPFRHCPHNTSCIFFVACWVASSAKSGHRWLHRFASYVSSPRLVSVRRPPSPLPLLSTSRGLDQRPAHRLLFAVPPSLGGVGTAMQPALLERFTDRLNSRTRRSSQQHPSTSHQQQAWYRISDSSALHPSLR